MDVSVEERGIEVFEECPNVETSSSEQDRSLGVLRAMFNGDKTYDNRTEEIYQVRELLIENRTTRSQAQVRCQDGDWRVSVTKAAVCMEAKGMGM